MVQKCILCGNKKFKHILKIKKAPFAVSKLLKKRELKKDKKISLDLIMCRSCGLFQLKKDNCLKPDFYTNYYMSVSYSRQMQKYQRWLAKDFIKTFNLKGKSSFKIGCGDGMFAQFLNKYGLKTIGIEPSKVFYNIAKKKIKVLNEYFNRNVHLKHHYYDAFLSRQVFEHLTNPNQILKTVKIYLKPEGVGLIEVPSFTTTLEKNRYYDIFPDHTVYYSEYTLQYLLNKHNFQIIKIFPTANNEYLTAYFRNNDYYDFKIKPFIKNYIKYKKEIGNLIYQYRNKNIAIWGAGGKGISLLTMFDISSKDVLFVIDSDPYKKNKYTPGSHILIKSPKEVDFKKIDLIIISAAMYQEEIIKDLRKKYKYQNKIATISPKPRLLRI